MNFEPSTAPEPDKVLVVDVGGFEIKYLTTSVDDVRQLPFQRIQTRLPASPRTLMRMIVEIWSKESRPGSIIMGFPGLVRSGCVIEAPTLSCQTYGGTRHEPTAQEWHNFPLREEITRRTGVAVLVVNDADLHALGAQCKKGVELALVLGTGVGTSLSVNGDLLPHLELSHFPGQDGRSVSEYLGNAERLKYGNEVWKDRLRRILPVFFDMVHFDHLIIGGGASHCLTPGDLAPFDFLRMPPDAVARGARRLANMHQGHKFL